MNADSLESHLAFRPNRPPTLAAGCSDPLPSGTRCHVLAFDIVAGLLQAQMRSRFVRRPAAEEPDHRHRRLLRARRERPNRRAVEQRDELAPFHYPMPPVLRTEG